MIIISVIIIKIVIFRGDSYIIDILNFKSFKVYKVERFIILKYF